MSYGATPAEWASATAGGYGPYLLPIVSNPNAVISPLSKMQGLGKTPSQYNGNGEAVGIPRWVQHTTRDTEVERWRTVPDLGYCVRTGGEPVGEAGHLGGACIAIDVDVDDPGIVADVRLMLDMYAPATAVRTRKGSPRVVYLFRVEGKTPKRRFKVKDTEKGAIELLGDGQQVVLAGQHASGERNTIELPPRESIPLLARGELDELWLMLAESFGVPGSEFRGEGAVALLKPRSAVDVDDPFLNVLYEHGAVLDEAPDGKAFVECPNIASHSSDNGPSQTAYMPAGLGGMNRGMSCLHAGCQGKPLLRMLAEGLGVLDELTAIERSEGRGPCLASDFDDVSGGAVADAALPEARFVRDKHGKILTTLRNLQQVLLRPELCGYRIAFDTFTDQLMIAGEGAGGWDVFADHHYVDLRVAAFERTGMDEPGRELTRDAVRWVAERNRFDSAIEWTDTLQWDGVERIERFFVDCFGVADTPYARAVGLYTWTGLAARCLEPGHQVDMVPVLVGYQGGGKTSAVRAMAPNDDTFVELNLETKDADLSRALRGKLVGELAELRGLNGRAAESIKAWITRRVEAWTPKFVEHETRFARRLLMIGTTNEQEFLADHTGERRWLPLTVGAVDVERIRREREQLWAEGLARFEKGGVQWREAQELARAEHAAYKVSDTLEDRVADWLAGEGIDGRVRGDGPVRLSDVMVGALGMTPDKQTMGAQRRVGQIMTGHGFRKRMSRLAGGAWGKVWVREALELA